MDEQLRVTFTASNTIPNKKPYTIYEIEVRTVSAKSWVIFKRYNEFHGLNQELIKSLSRSSVHLPTLPPKRLRSLNVHIVEKRMAELQDYLRQLLANSVVLKTEPMLNFLEVPTNIRELLHVGPTTQRKESASSPITKKSTSTHPSRSVPVDLQRVLDLAIQLNTSNYKVRAVQQFEKYFFDKRPRYTADVINILYRGDSNQGGLIRCCGDFKYSYIASHSALELLCRLLDVERNKDAKLFLDSFTSLEILVLKELNLHEHILSERGTRLSAFRLVKVLEEKVDAPLSVYVPDTWARQAYQKWANNQRKLTSVDIVDSSHSSSRIPSLSDEVFEEIVSDTFSEVLKIMDDDQGWQLMDNQGNSSLLTSYKMYEEMTVLRCVLAVPYSVDKVFALLNDCGRQREWNLQFLWGNAVEYLDSNTNLIHCAYTSGKSKHKFRDFALLKSWRDHLDGKFIGLRSVTHPKVPAYRVCLRGLLFPSGILIAPITLRAVDDEGAHAEVESCLVTFVMEFGPTASLLITPTLLGETTDLVDSFLNITTLLDIDEDARQNTTDSETRPVLSASEVRLQRTSCTVRRSSVVAINEADLCGSLSVLSLPSMQCSTPHVESKPDEPRTGEVSPVEQHLES
eukprot:964608_1